MDMNQVFLHCCNSIGGEDNEDVRCYRNRPELITRQSFFQKATPAIWVGGMGRKAVASYLDRAEASGFVFDFASVASWDQGEILLFLAKLHGDRVARRAFFKWSAVIQVAITMNSFSDEKAFRADFFQGKVRSKELDETDVQSLVRRKLSFIGPATAQLIIRNLGGEVIKGDRWLNEFARCAKMSLPELEVEVQRLGIPLGLFDIVIWAYCERFVHKVADLCNHLNEKIAGELVTG